MPGGTIFRGVGNTLGRSYPWLDGIADQLGILQSIPDPVVIARDCVCAASGGGSATASAYVPGGAPTYAVAARASAGTGAATSRSLTTADLTAISGAVFPTSGTATPGTTGLDTVTGLTHVGSADIPMGSTASGFLRGVDDAAASIRIDGTSVPNQSNETSYWRRCWVRFARTATPLAADGTSAQFHIVQATSPSTATKLRTFLYVRNLTHNPGLTLAVQEFLAGGTEERISGVGSSGSLPVIPFDAWVRIGFRVTRSTSGGVYALYFNDTLVHQHSGLPTDTEILPAGQFAAQTSFAWPAIAGVRVEFCGPFETYQLSGPAPGAWSPLHALNGTAGHLAQAHLCTPVGDGTPHGKAWTHSGAATATLTDYVTSGSNPNRRRYVYSGSAADTWSQTTRQALGPVSYNQQGDAQIVFPMLYVPGSASAQIVARYADGSPLVTLDIAGGQLAVGAANLAPWDHADRYALILHLPSSGMPSVSLYDLTEVNVAQNAWSAPIPAWTPGDLGTVTVSGVLGATAHECDGVWVTRWADVMMVDSLSHVMASGVSPSLAMTNHVSNALCPPCDAYLVPGAAYPNRVNGLDRRVACVVIGRAGMTRDAAHTYVLPYLDRAPGLELVQCDGGSINNFLGVANTAQQTAALDNLESLLTTMCADALTRRQRVWLTTMIRREQGTYTTIQNETIDLYNTRIRRVYRDGQSSTWYHLRFGDVALAIINHLALFTAGDDTHPNAAGAATMARAMIALPGGGVCAAGTFASGTRTLVAVRAASCQAGAASVGARSLRLGRTSENHGAGVAQSTRTVVPPAGGTYGRTASTSAAGRASALHTTTHARAAAAAAAGGAQALGQVSIPGVYVRSVRVSAGHQASAARRILCQRIAAAYAAGRVSVSTLAARPVYGRRTVLLGSRRRTAALAATRRSASLIP